MPSRSRGKCLTSPMSSIKSLRKSSKSMIITITGTNSKSKNRCMNRVSAATRLRLAIHTSKRQFSDNHTFLDEEVEMVGLQLILILAATLMREVNRNSARSANANYPQALSERETPKGSGSTPKHLFVLWVALRIIHRIHRPNSRGSNVFTDRLPPIKR